MLSPGVLKRSLIRLLCLYASQRGYFCNTDGSQLLMQSSCSCGGAHPHNGFQGPVRITVMGAPRSPAGGSPVPRLGFPLTCWCTCNTSVLSLRLGEREEVLTAENRCGFRCCALHGRTAQPPPAPAFNPARGSAGSPLCSRQSQSCLAGGHGEQNAAREEISAVGESTSVSSSTGGRTSFGPERPVSPLCDQRADLG